MFEILSYSFPYLVGESESDGGEGPLVEDAPDDSVVEGETGAFVLGDTVASASVHHVEETEVGIEADVDGVVA